MGLDGTLENETVFGFDHEALVGDKTRVEPYAAAIQKHAAGTDVLDIGTGPVCFLARLFEGQQHRCLLLIPDSLRVSLEQFYHLHNS
eukprot:5834402-Amphidinium_carterae.2